VPEELLGPARVAELVAPHLVRLRDAISDHLTPHVPALVEAHGIDRATGTMVALLRNQPAEASFPPEVLVDAFALAPAGSVWECLQDCQEAGLLEPDADGRLVRTARAMSFTADLVDRATRVAVELWSGEHDLVLRLVPLLERVARHASVSPGPRMQVFDWPHHVAGTPDEQVLAELLASLRYHRGDVLRRVCETEGLSPAQAESLPPGRARAGIEDRTNRLAGRPYGVLAGDERHVVVEGLARLPA
jgi:hypothetical protein